jgi:hypothetical protein
MLFVISSVRIKGTGNVERTEEIQNFSGYAPRKHLLGADESVS